MKNYKLVSEWMSGNRSSRIKKKMAMRPDEFKFYEYRIPGDIDGSIILYFSKNKENILLKYWDKCDFFKNIWGGLQVEADSPKEAKSLIKISLEHCPRNGGSFNITRNIGLSSHWTLKPNDVNFPLFIAEISYLTPKQYDTNIVITKNGQIDRGFDNFDHTLKTIFLSYPHDYIGHGWKYRSSQAEEYGFRNVYCNKGSKQHRTNNISFPPKIEWIWRKTGESKNSIWVEPIPLDEIKKYFGINI